jgi:hypothetical protein
VAVVGGVVVCWSAAPKPFPQERVEEFGPTVSVAMHVALVDDQSLERILQGGSRDPVLGGRSAAGRRPAVGECDKDNPLDAA